MKLTAASQKALFFCANNQTSLLPLLLLHLRLADKWWRSFRSILLYVLAHICFPSLLPPSLPSQSILGGITPLFHGNRLMRAGVAEPS